MKKKKEKRKKRAAAHLGRVLFHVQHIIVVALVLADALHLLLSSAARQQSKHMGRRVAQRSARCTRGTGSVCASGWESLLPRRLPFAACHAIVRLQSAHIRREMQAQQPCMTGVPPLQQPHWSGGGSGGSADSCGQAAHSGPPAIREISCVHVSTTVSCGRARRAPEQNIAPKLRHTARLRHAPAQLGLPARLHILRHGCKRLGAGARGGAGCRSQAGSRGVGLTQDCHRLYAVNDGAGASTLQAARSSRRHCHVGTAMPARLSRPRHLHGALFHDGIPPGPAGGPPVGAARQSA